LKPASAHGPSPIPDHGRRGKATRLAGIVLAADQSGALRDRMVAELGDLKSADEAAVWVHKNLPVKNKLTSADAELVEAKFRERLAVIEGGQSGAAPREAVAVPGGERRQGQSEAFDAPEAPAPAATVVRRRRVAGKTIRLRDKEHCKFVATQPCVVCGRTPAEAHHIRRARSIVRSAMNSRSRSAGSIIANCTATAMKPHGGPE
jgi:hypothetical protein